MLADASDIAVERFDRRLSEETGKLRLDFAEMKVDLLKWSFLFWIGQVAVLAGIIAFRLTGH
jgi:hypothetical protein